MADHGHRLRAMPIPASPFPTLPASSPGLPRLSTAKGGGSGGEIARLVQEHGVEELVMGYPRNMDGTEGPPGGAVPGLRSPGGGHRGAPARALGRTADHRGRPPYPV